MVHREMRKLSIKRRRRQKGAVLVLALIIIALGTAAVTGLLYYVNTSLLAHGKDVDRMEARYAADAGIEWFAAQLIVDTDISAYDQEDVDIYAGDSVNGHTPVVIITDITELTPGWHNRYIVESSADGRTVTATIDQFAFVGENCRVDVETWGTY